MGESGTGRGEVSWVGCTENIGLLYLLMYVLMYRDLVARTGRRDWNCSAYLGIRIEIWEFQDLVEVENQDHS